MNKNDSRYESRSAAVYNALANDYENTFDGRFTQKFKTMLVEAVKLQDGYNVLDVACGNGRLLKMFADKCAINGYGTDISGNMIAQARRLNPLMEFSVGRCEQTPFAGGTFDVITVCAAYHHFPDVKSFAQEAYRLLKTQGKIYIADIYYPRAIRAVCNPFIRFSKAGDVKLYSPQEIIATLYDAGLNGANHIIDGHVQIVSARRE
ncbi:MAG: class I SAM-dependent methyltransferase [Oscillospiraceae bacterium]|jgi:ubiquinone/menaquinone biosynthesis C-methylase UbiE|nr:class I SAM-dependent methyltransferase [Oscillospiraceae bacterium]